MPICGKTKSDKTLQCKKKKEWKKGKEGWKREGGERERDPPTILSTQGKSLY